MRKDSKDWWNIVSDYKDVSNFFSDKSFLRRVNRDRWTTGPTRDTHERLIVLSNRLGAPRGFKDSRVQRRGKVKNLVTTKIVQTSSKKLYLDLWNIMSWSTRKGNLDEILGSSVLWRGRHEIEATVRIKSRSFWCTCRSRTHRLCTWENKVVRTFLVPQYKKDSVPSVGLCTRTVPNGVLVTKDTGIQVPVFIVAPKPPAGSTRGTWSTSLLWLKCSSPISWVGGTESPVPS